MVAEMNLYTRDALGMEINCITPVEQVGTVLLGRV